MRMAALFLANLQLAAASTQSKPYDASSLTSSAQPLPLFDLPNALCESDFVSDPSDLEAIRNTLAYYPLAIDGKNFAALGRVFTHNAIANYSTPLGVLTPLSTIISALKASLAVVMTQHSYGTQVISIVSPVSAISITYFTATHFGTREHIGQLVTAYGQYQDVWTRQSDSTWRIVHRNLVYMVCSKNILPSAVITICPNSFLQGPLIGNLSIFT